MLCLWMVGLEKSQTEYVFLDFVKYTFIVLVCLVCLLPRVCISVSCRVAHRKNEVANNEATAFSIFYNNALFFFLFMLIAYFFRLLHPGMYPPTDIAAYVCTCH